MPFPCVLVEAFAKLEVQSIPIHSLSFNSIAYKIQYMRFTLNVMIVRVTCTCVAFLETMSDITMLIKGKSSEGSKSHARICV